MKVIDHIKRIALKVWRLQALKYVVVCAIGISLVGFLDDNSVLSHLRNRQRINELQEEIDVYNANFERDQAQIRELRRNPKAVEKVARERYFMKAEDEDIFILSDDERTPQSIVDNERTN
jgi:cell division protein FtsB